MNTFFFIFNLAMVVLIAAFVMITPRLTRQSLLFGVRVPEYAASLPEVRKLRRSYVTIVGMGGLAVLGAAVLQYAAAPDLSLLALLYFPFILIGVQFAAYIPQWKKAKALKAQNGWGVPQTATAETRSSAEREKLSSLPWGWYIASTALVLVSMGWSAAVYPTLPERIATHWDLYMQPDQWADKSLLTLLAVPLIALGTVALMVGVNVMLYKQKLQVSAEHPALSFAQHRMYRRMLSRALGFLTLCIAVMFAIMQAVAINLFTPPPAFFWVTIFLIAAGTIPSIYVPIKAGQSGCRLKPTVRPEDALSESLAVKVKDIHPGRGDDQSWKLGMFYYNPDDPAVLVEDRFGGNSGFNYARLPAKLFAAGIAVLLVASYVAITYFVLKYPLG